MDVTLDSGYLRELTQLIQASENQLAEAKRALSRAERQTGWNCPERHEINARLSELSRRLGDLSARLDAVAGALRQGTAEHDAWEQKALQRKNALAASLQKNLGFPAAAKNGGAYTLPTSPVPKLNLPAAKVSGGWKPNL